MLTLYAFANIFPGGEGETKDLRAQWVLEETGLPYRVHALDQMGGELDGEAYGRLNPFRQVPAIDDDGFVLTESGAIALYLAEKSGRLIPADVQGRTRVTQWIFSATTSVEPSLLCLDMLGIFDQTGGAKPVADEVKKIAARFLGSVETRLEGREWIACSEFTVADVMLACVLRSQRKTDLLQPFPRVRAYYDRCFARPAWQRTLAMYAGRFGIDVERIR